MKYILKTLDIMDYIAKELNIEVIENNRYNSIIATIVENKDRYTLSEDIRNKISGFLISVEVPNRDILIYKIKFPNTSIDEIDSSELGKYSELDLDDSALLTYFTRVLRSVVYLQNGDLLLLKYAKSIWETGWSNLAKQCRGKVIDINTREIVAYPFNKFFNLDEVEETKENRIRELLNESDNIISITDKKDGSAIIITNHKGKIVINTNGEFDNIQVKLAKRLFESKYTYFYNNVPEGYTFVFELIHPDNKIVIDYGDEEKLYLLAVRNLKTLELMDYSELLVIKDKYNLDITESFEYSDLSDFLDKAVNDVESGKEGWVFSIKNSSNTFMFKLKFKEYFKLSRLKNKPSLKKVYSLLISNTLDDVLADAEDGIKEIIDTNVKVIYDYIEKFKSLIVSESESVLRDLGYNEVDNSNIREIILRLKDNPFSPYILKYVKGNKDLDYMFNLLPKPSAFEKLYDFTNDKLGIQTVKWDEIQI